MGPLLFVVNLLIKLKLEVAAVIASPDVTTKDASSEEAKEELGLQLVQGSLMVHHGRKPHPF